MDRGTIGGNFYDKFLEKGKEKRFVMRLQKNRDLVHKGIKKNCFLLRYCASLYETAIIKYEEGKEQKTTIFYNAVAVELPEGITSCSSWW